MNTGERFKMIQRFSPLHSIAKFIECFRLPLLQFFKRLNDYVTSGVVEVGQFPSQRLKNVSREVAVVCALFDDQTILGLSHSLPNFGELKKIGRASCRERV